MKKLEFRNRLEKQKLEREQHQHLGKVGGTCTCSGPWCSCGYCYHCGRYDDGPSVRSSMKIANPRKLERAICKALDLDVDLTKDIYIFLRVDHVPRIVVNQYITDEQGKKLTEVIRKSYLICEKAEVERLKQIADEYAEVSRKLV